MLQNVAISVISLFPLCWGPGGPKRVLDMIRRLGIKVQLIPQLGWRKSDFNDFSPDLVSSYEGSWLNSFKELKTEGKRLDWITPICPLLFGTRRNTENQLEWFRDFFPSAIAIDLPWGITEIVERKGETLENFLDQPGPYVFDTWHAQEITKNHDNIVRFFRQLLDSGKIAMVHLQTRSPKEFSAFLKRESSFMGDILTVLGGRKEKIGIVFEIPCFFLWPDPVRSISKLINVVTH